MMRLVSALCAGALGAALPCLAAAATLTEADTGKSFNVASGEVLTVRLPGIRGAGFWRLDSDVSPELSLAGRSTESVLAPDAPETTIFTFAPRQAGTVTLKASYVKTGTEQTPVHVPAESFAVLVTVQGS